MQASIPHQRHSNTFSRRDRRHEALVVYHDAAGQYAQKCHAPRSPWRPENYFSSIGSCLFTAPTVEMTHVANGSETRHHRGKECNLMQIYVAEIDGKPI